MPSENNDQNNEITQGNPGEDGSPIYDERKAYLVAKFKADVMPKTELREFKSALSGFLFTEAPHEAINGVGIGKLEGNGDCVRIYYDDRKADDAREVMQSFADLSEIAVTIPQPLPSTKPVDVPLTNGVTIQLIRAPQAVLSGVGVSSTTGVSVGDVDYGVERPRGLTETEVLTIPCNAAREYTILPAGTSIWSKPAAKGTIGYFCVDSQGINYVLSCNHVLADFAGAGDSMDKRPLFRDSSGSTIVPLATLSEFVPLDEVGDNRVDAALAEISYGIQNRIIEGVTINAMTNATDGVVDLTVEKHGLATCGTIGVIDDQSCDMRVNGPNGRSYLFKDQIRIVSNDKSKVFADRGDSGALVYERGPTPAVGKAVGLLFAVGNKDYLPSGLDEGADRTIDYALANPINTVMRELRDRLRTRLADDDLTLDLIPA